MNFYPLIDDVMEKFVAETRTFFDEEAKEELMELNAEAFRIFKKRKGLITIQMHLNHEENRTMTLLEWETKEDHEACMQSPDFGKWGTEWQRLIEEGNIRWELETCEVFHEFRKNQNAN